jgi:hypothetical protein
LEWGGSLPRERAMWLAQSNSGAAESVHYGDAFGGSTRRIAAVSVTTWERKPQQGKEDGVRAPLKRVRDAGTLPLAQNVGAGGGCRRLRSVRRKEER